jgi:hypothetical protein
MKMPPPIDSIRRMSARTGSFSLTEESGATTWGAESMAMQPNSSMGPSRSRTSTVPRLARSILHRPPPTGTAMLPERSSATTMATDILRCSLRSSIDTGRIGSKGDL